MSLQQLKKDLSEGLAPLYLFVGEEDYFKRHYLNLIKNKLLSGFEEFDLSVFDGKKLSAAELQDALDALPLSAEKRLIIIYDLPLAKSNEAASFLSKNGVPDTACVVVSEEQPPLSDTAAEVKRFASDTGAVVVRFDPLSGAEQTDWTVRYFAAAGKKIERADAEYLASVCLPSQNAVKNECDKLISRAEKPVITRELIDEMVAPTADAKGWQLSEAVVFGRTAEALKIVSDLFTMKTDENVVAAAVYRAYCDLAAVVAGAASGKSTYDIAAASGMKEFVCRKYLPVAKKLSLKTLSSCVEECLKCDVDLKSTPADKRARVEELIIKTAEIRKNGSR